MQAQELIALRVGVDMKLFDAAAMAASKAASKGHELRIEELSSEANADPVLVSRCWTNKCICNKY